MAIRSSLKAVGELKPQVIPEGAGTVKELLVTVFCFFAVVCAHRSGRARLVGDSVETGTTLRRAPVRHASQSASRGMKRSPEKNARSIDGTISSRRPRSTARQMASAV